MPTVAPDDFLQQFLATTERQAVRGEPLNEQKVYSAGLVETLEDWNMVQTPMAPVTVQGLPGSAAGAVNYSPFAHKQVMGNDAVWERLYFRRYMMDPRRMYNARKAVMYDLCKLMRRRQDERFQYVAPGTPEAYFIENMLAKNADKGTGLAPEGISFLYDRM